jgi:hypothetical protein
MRSSKERQRNGIAPAVVPGRTLELQIRATQNANTTPHTLVASPRNTQRTHDHQSVTNDVRDE